MAEKITGRAADELGWRRYPPRHPLVLVVSCQNPEWYEQADIWEAVHAADQDRINREMLAIFGSRIFVCPSGAKLKEPVCCGGIQPCASFGIVRFLSGV